MVTANKDSQACYVKRGLAVLIGILILDAIDMVLIGRDFLIPVVIAFLIAITFRPAIRWLAVRGVPAWATASGLAAGILLGGFLTGYMISGPVSGWIANAPEIRRALAEKIRGIRAHCNYSFGCSLLGVDMGCSRYCCRRAATCHLKGFQQSLQFALSGRRISRRSQKHRKWLP